MALSHDKPIIVFGEVLFDVLPDGKEILGGAPFNVAWHLQGFGYKPLMLSRVGNDVRGKKIRNVMQQWGMDTRGLQIDSSYPTGMVSISHGEHGPKFQIEPNQAYDHILLDDTLANLTNNEFALLLHGTLAIRSETSRQSLVSLRGQLQLPVLADLNLRTPWWNPSIVEDTLKNTRWVKVNDEELKIISRKEATSKNQYIELATQLINQYKNIELLLVTLGAEGSLALKQDGEVSHEKGIPIPPTEFKDTVGAGDAFTAVVTIGLLEGWDIDAILQRANRFASEICKIHGATTIDRTIYDTQLKYWGA